MGRERMGVAVGIALLALLTACAGENRGAEMGSVEKGGDDRTGEYMPAEGFWKDNPEAADGYSYAQISGVAADTPDRIIVGIRGDLTPEGEERPNSSNYLVVVDGSGDIIERWTQWDTVVGFPHHIYISPYDPERHIWVVDRGGTMRTVHEQILKFTNDGGELVMRLRDPSPTQTQGGPVRAGQPEPGTARLRPAIDPGCFSRTATSWWATATKTAGSYASTPRVSSSRSSARSGADPASSTWSTGVAVDRDRRIYVVDRRNSRVQVFTEDGEYIEEWPDITYPSGIYIDENDGVWLWSGCSTGSSSTTRTACSSTTSPRTAATTAACHGAASRGAWRARTR